jgi:hypothetical protein
MDPGSVVREGELALASGTGSFAQNLEGAISKLKSGQRLPPEVRMNLVKAMQRRGVELARNYNRVRDQYTAACPNATGSIRKTLWASIQAAISADRG